MLLLLGMDLEELNEMRSKLEASNMSAKYDSTSRMSMKNSLTLSEDEVNERLDRGDAYIIRIKLPRNEEIRFHDVIRGWIVFNSSQLDDKVLLKEDGLPTYHLANIVDDHLMEISHVIRGEEWLPSAPLHVMLYRFLGWETTMPKFAHLPLILKPDGKGKLNKRDGDRLGFPVFPIEWTSPEGEVSSGYRESGYLSKAVVNMLSMLGWHQSDNQELFTLEELVEAFELERVSKSLNVILPKASPLCTSEALPPVYLDLSNTSAEPTALSQKVRIAILPLLPISSICKSNRGSVVPIPIL